MRYDYFLVWGNGLQHLSGIMEIIEDRFHILYETKVTYNDTREFITGLYECDNAPMQHILAKTIYLEKSPKEAYFVLVINYKPREHPTKTGKQCSNIQEAKIEIRNKFNPRWGSGQQKNPLNPGVSHDHVIHASDYESQVHHALEYLRLPPLCYFSLFSNKVDIRKILKDAPDYVVIKMSGVFPLYNSGSDVDIMCGDIEKVAQHITGKLKTRRKDKAKKIHLDYYDGNKLDLRFDLIPATSGILERKEKRRGVYVPVLEDELEIRKREFKKYPHKKHHKQFIDEHTD